jgi:hypothetical protein
MAGWLVLTLWLPVNSNAVQPAVFRHVRSSEAVIRALVVDGYRRSATFRVLVDAIEKSACVVYISSAVKLSNGMRGALLHWPVARGEMSMLRVLLKTNLSPDEGISVVGHELQHVLEAIAGLQQGLQVTAVFERLEPAARGKNLRKYETDDAIAVEAKVLAELKYRPRSVTR